MLRSWASLVLMLAAAVLLHVYPMIHAETVTGPVTHARDGYTIEVAGLPIRLQGLNCAELGTRLGSEGRAAMSRLISGQQLT